LYSSAAGAAVQAFSETSTATCCAGAVATATKLVAEFQTLATGATLVEEVTVDVADAVVAAKSSFPDVVAAAAS
jgi:hypothetical protein